LRKRFTENITIDSTGQINHQLTAEFQNTAASDNWPAGEYRSYLRLYLPSGSQVGEISLRNGSTGAVTPITKPDVSEEHQKTVLGFTFEVPVKESRLVTVSYKSPSSLNMHQKASLLFSWRRQPGTSDDQASWLVTAPTDFELASTPSQGIFDIPNSVRYNLTLSTDKEIQVDLLPSH
jgi:hypothetical protein